MINLLYFKIAFRYTPDNLFITDISILVGYGMRYCIDCIDTDVIQNNQMSPTSFVVLENDYSVCTLFYNKSMY